MSFNNINNLSLGEILQIAFTEGVLKQQSQDFAEFEMVRSRKIKGSPGLARELRYYLQSYGGAASVQHVDPGTKNRAFPSGYQAEGDEYAAKLKELDVTVELEHNLWERAMESGNLRYTDPWALEMENKLVEAKRVVAMSFWGDGSGAVAELSTTASISSGVVTLTFKGAYDSIGFVGRLREGDFYIVQDVAGSTYAEITATVSSGTYAALKCISRDLKNNQATFKAVNSSGTELTATVLTVAAGDMLYRYGQKSDIANIDRSSVTDWGTLSPIPAGMLSLAANDGRTVNGLTMSGVTAGTHLDASGALIDVDDVHEILDDLTIRVGQGRYVYDQAAALHQTVRSLITSREADRRFNTVQDGARGVNKFTYQYGDMTVSFFKSEFINPGQMWFIPKPKGGQENPLEFWGSEFRSVKAPGGVDTHLKASSSGYVNMIQHFLRSYHTFICRHPASIGFLKNFTVA